MIKLQAFRRGMGLGSAALLLMLSFTGCGEAPKTVKLAMKFTPGQQLVYEMTSEYKIRVDSPDPASEDSRSKGEMIQETLEVLPDGSARVKESSSWSWTEPDSDGSVKVVSSTESLTYRIAPSGRISEFEILNDDEASQWREYAQSKLEQSQPTFPEEEVPIGYTWMQSVKIFKPNDEALDATTTYKVSELVEVDGRKCAVIDYQGNLVLPFDVVESDSLARKGVDKVDQTGTIWFDIENGYVFSQHETTKIEAERARIGPSEAKTYTASIDGELFFTLKPNE